MITDYARGKTPGSPEFEKYIETTGYNVVEPEAYGRLLEAAGFTDVVVDDATARFIEILKSETGQLVDNPDGVSCVVLRSRLEIPGRSLGDESRFLQERRHEVGQLPGDQKRLIPVMSDDTRDLAASATSRFSTGRSAAFRRSPRGFPTSRS